MIVTKYIGPSNIKGARISAHAPGWNLPRVYIPYPHEKSGVECHAEAALALLKKAKKSNQNFIFLYAAMPNGYCFMDRDNGPSIILKG